MTTAAAKYKKESVRFSGRQAAFLLKLAEQHEKVIRDKSNTSEAIERKREAWSTIHKQFVSSLEGIPNATLEQLKNKFQNMNAATKKNRSTKPGHKEEAKCLEQKEVNNGSGAIPLDSELGLTGKVILLKFNDSSVASDCSVLEVDTEEDFEKIELKAEPKNVTMSEVKPKRVRQVDVCRNRESKLLCQKYHLECELIKKKMALAEKQLKSNNN